MLPGDRELHAAIELPPGDDVAGIEPLFHRDIFRVDVTPFAQAKGHHPAGETLHRTAGVFIVAVDDDGPVFRREEGKAAEGGDDIVGVLEKVQMIPVDVQNHRHRGPEGQEGIAVFAGLGHEEIAVADAQSPPDGGELAPHHDGGIERRRRGNGGDHGSGGGRAVGPGHTHHPAIVVHDHPPGLGPGDHGDLFRPGRDDLGIVIPDGGGADDQGGSQDIFRPVADGDGDAALPERLGMGAFVPVAAPDRDPHVPEHPGQSAHGNAADAHQVDGPAAVENMLKRLFVHEKNLLKS